MKKIILWISAITRYIVLVLSREKSIAYKSTNPSKRHLAIANGAPKNACMGLNCQRNCIRKAMPIGTKGEETINSKYHLTQIYP